MRPWDDGPPAVLERVHRELELYVMPGLGWLARDEARRRGVPAHILPRIMPSPITGRPSTYRWEWWEVRAVD